MGTLKKIPDTEFEIMKVVWANEPPITTEIIMRHLGNERGWKAPTTINLLLRLVERGFLKTEKRGKERIYFPLITEEEYLKFETSRFIKQYHKNSFINLFTTFYDNEQNITDEDIEALLKIMKERRE